LFDEFRINAVKVVFRPSKMVSLGPLTAGYKGQFPQIWVAKDRNDAAAPATYQDLVNLAGVRRKFFTDTSMSYSVYLKPTVITSGSPKTSQWLSTSSQTTVDHFGIKAAGLLWFNGLDCSMDITYYVQFRGVKA